MSRSVHLLVLLSAIALAQAAHALEIRDARAPQPPAGAPVMAGYMEIVNHRDESVKVRGGHSPEFDRISLHETIVENDSAHMQAVEYFTVPAGGTVEMAPRGKHLMLYQPPADIRVGDEIPLRLDTSIGSIEITLAVTEPIGHDGERNDDDAHDEHD